MRQGIKHIMHESSKNIQKNIRCGSCIFFVFQPMTLGGFKFQPLLVDRWFVETTTMVSIPLASMGLVYLPIIYHSFPLKTTIINHSCRWIYQSHGWYWEWNRHRHRNLRWSQAQGCIVRNVTFSIASHRPADGFCLHYINNLDFY